jgi:hypothetical protein
VGLSCNSTDIAGFISAMLKKIDKFKVAELLGSRDCNFALQRMKYDPNFPRNYSGGKNAKMYWLESEILEFKKTFKKRGVIYQDKQTGIDNRMAQLYIRLCGMYWLIDTKRWVE